VLQRKTPLRTKPLKRTQLKRSTKRINRVSKKNAKPHRNQEVIDAYRTAHKSCALCGRPRDHIHHLCAGSRARVDHVANIIALCWGCHAEVHNKPVEGRIRCMSWKLKHGEFDAVALSGISGENVVGWLSRQSLSVELESMRVVLVKASERV
jgi:hypothetical protein